MRMRVTAPLLLALALVATTSIALAQSTGGFVQLPPQVGGANDSARLAQNKATVVAFYEMAVNGKQPQAAADRYMGPVYIQHNPLAASGKEAFVAFFSGFATQFPEGHVDIRRVVAEGDLVVTHSLFTLGPADRGSAVMDIFRLENGKVVEHWDVIQAVPENPLNDNTMF